MSPAIPLPGDFFDKDEESAPTSPTTLQSLPGDFFDNEKPEAKLPPTPPTPARLENFVPPSIDKRLQDIGVAPQPAPKFGSNNILSTTPPAPAPITDPIERMQRGGPPLLPQQPTAQMSPVQPVTSAIFDNPTIAAAKSIPRAGRPIRMAEDVSSGLEEAIPAATRLLGRRNPGYRPTTDELSQPTTPITDINRLAAGTMKAGMPLLAGTLGAGPRAIARTGVALAAGQAGATIASRGAEALGASPEVAELAGNIGGLVAGIGGERGVSKFLENRPLPAPLEPPPTPWTTRHPEALDVNWEHGTQPEAASEILRTGKLDPSKSVRQYDYSTAGPDAVYLGASGSYWYKPELGGRTIDYKSRVNVGLSPDIRIAEIRTVEEADAFARRYGYQNNKELSNALFIDDLHGTRETRLHNLREALSDAEAHPLTDYPESYRAELQGDIDRLRKNLAETEARPEGDLGESADQAKSIRAITDRIKQDYDAIYIGPRADEIVGSSNDPNNIHLGGGGNQLIVLNPEKAHPFPQAAPASDINGAALPRESPTNTDLSLDFSSNRKVTPTRSNKHLEDWANEYADVGQLREWDKIEYLNDDNLPETATFAGAGREDGTASIITKDGQFDVDPSRLSKMIRPMAEQVAEVRDDLEFSIQNAQRRGKDTTLLQGKLNELNRQFVDVESSPIDPASIPEPSPPPSPTSTPAPSTPYRLPDQQIIDEAFGYGNSRATTIRALRDLGVLDQVLDLHASGRLSARTPDNEILGLIPSLKALTGPRRPSLGVQLVHAYTTTPEMIQKAWADRQEIRADDNTQRRSNGLPPLEPYKGPQPDFLSSTSPAPSPAPLPGDFFDSPQPSSITPLPPSTPLLSREAGSLAPFTITPSKNSPVSKFLQSAWPVARRSIQEFSQATRAVLSPLSALSPSNQDLLRTHLLGGPSRAFANADALLSTARDKFSRMSQMDQVLFTDEYMTGRFANPTNSTPATRDLWSAANIIRDLDNDNYRALNEVILKRNSPKAYKILLSVPESQRTQFLVDIINTRPNPNNPNARVVSSDPTLQTKAESFAKLKGANEDLLNHLEDHLQQRYQIRPGSPEANANLIARAERIRSQLPPSQYNSFVLDVVKNHPPIDPVAAQTFASLSPGDRRGFQLLADQITSNAKPLVPNPLGSLPTPGLGRNLSGTGTSFHRRIYSTLTEAMDFGAVPHTYNPVDNFLNGYRDTQKWLASKRLFDQLKSSNQAQFVRGDPSLPQFARQLAESYPGWAAPRDHSFQPTFTSPNGVVHSGAWIVPEPIANALNNWTSRDLFRDESTAITPGQKLSSSIGSKALFAKNLTTAFELAWPAFHYTVVNNAIGESLFGLGIREIVNSRNYKQGIYDIGRGLTNIPPGFDVLRALTGKAIAKVTGTATPPSSIAASLHGGTHVYRLGDVVTRLLAEGRGVVDSDAKFNASTYGQDLIKSLGPDARKMVSSIFDAGGRIDMSPEFKTRAIRGFMEALHGQKQRWLPKEGIYEDRPAGNILESTLYAIPAAAEMAMRPLFEDFIPRAKIGLFLREQSQALAENSADLAAGRTTETQIAAKTWRFVEDRLGEMNFDRLFWNRSLKTAMQVTFRSITWRLGSGDAWLGTGKDLLAIPGDVVRGKPIQIRPNLAWAMGVLAFSTAAAGTLQYLMTGKKLGETDDGKIDPDLAIVDSLHPRHSQSPDGKWIRTSILTYVRDLEHMGTMSAAKLLLRRLRDLNLPVSGEIADVGHESMDYIKSGLSSVLMRGAEAAGLTERWGGGIADPTDSAARAVYKVLRSFAPENIAFSSIQDGATRQGQGVIESLRHPTPETVLQTTLGMGRARKNAVESPAMIKAQEIVSRDAKISNPYQAAREESNERRKLQAQFKSSNPTLSVDFDKIRPGALHSLSKDLRNQGLEAFDPLAYRIAKIAEPEDLVMVFRAMSQDERSKLGDLLEGRLQKTLNNVSPARRDKVWSFWESSQPPPDTNPLKRQIQMIQGRTVEPY